MASHFMRALIQMKNFLAKEMLRASIMQNRIEKGRLNGILQNW